MYSGNSNSEHVENFSTKKLETYYIVFNSKGLLSGVIWQKERDKMLKEVAK